VCQVFQIQPARVEAGCLLTGAEQEDM